MLHKTKLHIVFLLVLTLLFATACDGDSQSDQPEATQAPPDDVTLQISWVHEYSSSVFHVAERNGFFSGQNLNVNLVEGGFGETGYIDPITEVVNAEGLAFGLSDSASLIQARAAEQPVVAILSVLQRGPNALISLSSNNIVVPDDLVGQSISASDGGAMQYVESFLAAQNIAQDSVTLVSRTDFGVDPLLNGDVDALYGWIINEGVMIEEAGETPSYILLSDYGVDSYSFVLFTTEATIANNPEVVQRLVNAVLEALQSVVDNPGNAIDQTVTYDDTLDREAQLRRLEATIPLINVPGLDLGTMQPAIWEAVHDSLIDQGVLSEAIDLDAVYDLTFVNAFHTNNSDNE